MENEAYKIELTKEEFDDIEEALKCKANTAMNMYDESMYKHYMSLARKLSVKWVIQNNISARHTKNVENKEPTKPDKIIVMQSDMNQPTFLRNSFKTH